jgi:hypothetical protein
MAEELMSCLSVLTCVLRKLEKTTGYPEPIWDFERLQIWRIINPLICSAYVSNLIYKVTVKLSHCTPWKSLGGEDI